MTVCSAVVLAAGEGARLRPLTRNRPKPMLPATTRPVLSYVLDALVEAGVEEMTLVVGYRRDRVQDHFGDEHRGASLSYVVQDAQLGSGHALLTARAAVDGPFLAVNGDQVVAPEVVADVREAFGDGVADGHPTAALAVVERADVSEYGAVVLNDDRVTELVEKPGSDRYSLLNAGVYAFDEGIFDALDSTPRVDGELALTDTLRRLVAAGRVQGVRTSGSWVDATRPWDLLSVSHELLVAGCVDEPERDERVWVADGADVHESATLRPPVVVGADCTVAAGAVVGPDVALGRNVTVGANAVVEASVLDDDTRVGPNATLVDCVTGQGVRLGAGATVPGGPGDVRVDDVVHEDERLGALLADRVRAAGDASFAPGTLVGPGTTIAAGASVSGTVAEQATVVR
ncbi:sugar phosphate nucleotidyltransferase [Halomicrococcus sp. NG-SE-24]|uniref:sugar phosphate nucleotidyltransferase n=1 Tax=Halomicrococcus sp. NG-SE-24 TaxID=3436928 RepID=UPI003D954E28